jgi:hypothetical protein
MQAHVADELSQVVETASEMLGRVSEEAALTKPADGKWSKKQILGHLIDSAVNNHHRFVRAQEVEELSFPRYEQKHWVDVQGYEESSWTELIELWRLYNRHLAQVIRRIPDGSLKVACRIGPQEPVSLEFLVEDYLVHLKHHLGQLGAEGREFASQ